MSGILLSLEFDQKAITDIRHLVRRTASGYGLAGDALDDYVLAVHEAVTNAVRYGRAPHSIAIWEQSGAVYCEVQDSGPGIPYRILKRDELAERLPLGGRGLWLMRRLARIIIHTGADGTTVRLAAILP
ncbi:ATP-binding protein [Acrocarpospora catenulata]|uniref:ATP-binding protein n=1 Tax=Acrocarpospora catenulata TaxID=2836182 RepID=UPI001BDB2DC3|nr:ATP-binding protein [Acrocarpospora catenulata]